MHLLEGENLQTALSAMFTLRVTIPPTLGEVLWERLCPRNRMKLLFVIVDWLVQLCSWLLPWC